MAWQTAATAYLAGSVEIEGRRWWIACTNRQMALPMIWEQPTMAIAGAKPAHQKANKYEE
jgi:hypothetical protein